MLYMILAHDGDDPQAPQRRQAVRESHLAGMKTLVDDGRVPFAAALLDDAGNMIGSALTVEADSEEDARALIEADIYHREGVWVKYSLWPVKRAF